MHAGVYFSQYRTSWQLQALRLAGYSMQTTNTACMCERAAAGAELQDSRIARTLLLFDAYCIPMQVTFLSAAFGWLWGQCTRVCSHLTSLSQLASLPVENDCCTALRPCEMLKLLLAILQKPRFDSKRLQGAKSILDRGTQQ